MRVEVVVPQIGEAVSELMLVAWLKQPGDMVQTGDVLFEIDSDKAIVEIEAFVDGKLVDILAAAGSAVMPRDVVGVIETVAEEPAATSATPVPETAPVKQTLEKEPAAARNASPVAQRIAKDHGVDLYAVTGSGPRGRIVAQDIHRHISAGVPASARINASPKAKRLAGEWHVDLSSLAGTGVDGMIRVKDVEAARDGDIVQPVAPAANGSAADVEALNKTRQMVALRTQQSKQQVPHFYLIAEVNMTQAKVLRAYCVDVADWERSPTYTAILIRACALALNALPWANRSYQNDGLAVRDHRHIGVAVDTSDGLMVPIIKDAGTMTLQQTAQTLRDVAGRAQSGRLKPSDIGEKSMTISNLGMYSVDQFIAIIDQPDPMILAVGRIADRVVPVDGQASIQPMCTLTLSVDHRVLDGAQGARFLECVKNYLENPFEILGP